MRQINIIDVLIVLMLPYNKEQRESWEVVWSEAYYLNNMGFKPAEHILAYIDRQQGTEIIKKDIDFSAVNQGLLTIIDGLVGKNHTVKEICKKHKSNLHKLGIEDYESYINTLKSDLLLQQEMESKNRAGKTSTGTDKSTTTTSSTNTQKQHRATRKDKGGTHKRAEQRKPRNDKGKKRMIYNGKPTVSSQVLS